MIQGFAHCMGNTAESKVTKLELRRCMCVAARDTADTCLNVCALPSPSHTITLAGLTTRYSAAIDQVICERQQQNKTACQAGWPRSTVG